MILVIGEILFDLFADNKKLGGAPFNFAFHLKKLGFPVRFISRVGKDALGREILYFLKQHQFDLSDIQIDPDHDTGTVKVTMSHEDHVFAITPDTAWAHLSFDRGLSTRLQQSCDLLYFGSLIQHSENGTALIQKVMRQKQSGTTVFCDLNLRPGFYGPAVIKAVLKASDILKLNCEEWLEFSDIRISETLNREIMSPFMTANDLELIILTLGSLGSQWITREKSHSCPPLSLKKVVDTVGAGDAYAAVSAAGWLNKLPIDTIMDLAGEFAGHICGIKGALPEDEHIYNDVRQRIQKK
ncbi:MAG: carbohydrate kinase [Deltaproteobacteria bacterium]|uniref:carbohydrate kinase family protein n=1 Tax=Desulfobacula sp. TaxID=2593537 RepID=UPI0019CF4698|nr:carbohydrate kinase [Candidatus Desulfobacula maris]MBL6993232.1 carbohydrate kinase [Desulfobacula sp.]